jgi:hypothetical protein
VLASRVNAAVMSAGSADLVQPVVLVANDGLSMSGAVRTPVSDSVVVSCHRLSVEYQTTSNVSTVSSTTDPGTEMTAWQKHSRPSSNSTTSSPGVMSAGFSRCNPSIHVCSADRGVVPSLPNSHSIGRPSMFEPTITEVFPFLWRVSMVGFHAPRTSSVRPIHRSSSSGSQPRQLTIFIVTSDSGRGGRHAETWHSRHR